MKWDGLKNFRDLGGIRTEDGRKVRHGLLFRSDCLFKASDRDRRLLSRLVRDIIDLRTELEIKEMPDAVVEGVNNTPIPMFTESVIGITHETGSDYGKFIRHCRDRRKVREIVPDMNYIYSYVMTDKLIVERIGETIRRIVDNVIEGKATLFHCSQGKDRAGAVAALTLSLLGVEDEKIFDDYARTNRVVRRGAILNSLLVCIFKLNPTAAMRVYRASIANRAYIRASFAVIDREYGSKADFFRNQLGISDSLRDRFRAAALTI